MVKPDKILLIDGLNFAYKSNVSFKPSNQTDISYTVVYGFFRSLRALIEEFSPTKIFFCDEGSNNFRRNIDSGYKANRIIKRGSKNPKSQEDFYRQKRIIDDLLKHLPITTVRADTFEADDVIATLVEDLKNESVIIISNDSDYVQLLQRGYTKLKLYDPFKKTFVVAPSFHSLTYKCLGDETDNVKRLVSKKIATELASDINALKEFLSNEENRSNYTLNKQLVELKPFDNKLLKFGDYKVDFARLKASFVAMDFKTMVEDGYWDRFMRTFRGLR